MGLLAPRGQPVHKAPKALRVRKVFRVSMGLKALTAHKARKGHKVLAFKVQQERKEQLALRARKGRKGRRVLGYKEHKAFKALRETLGHKAPGRKERKARQALKEQLALKEQPVLRVRKGHKALKDQAFKALLGLKGLKVLPDRKALPEHREPLAHR